MFAVASQPHSSHTLADLAAASYDPQNVRTDVGLYSYDNSISGPRTAVYHGPKGTVVAHRGTVPSDGSDVASDAKIAMGYLPKKSRLAAAAGVSQAAAASAQRHGGAIVHTGHSLGGAVARKIGRDRGEPNVTFNRYTGAMPNSENRRASKACKKGRGGPECHNTSDYYNKRDVAVLRIGSDYGKKHPTGTATGGPLSLHAVKQFQTPEQQGMGMKKKRQRVDGDHPQQALMDLAFAHM